MKKKEIHFWLNGNYPNDEILHAYCYTKFAIDRDMSEIHTTQIALISTKLITEYGYRIFVHDYKDNRFEITLGSCERIDREITESMNLEKMLLNGAFGDVTGTL